MMLVFMKNEGRWLVNLAEGEALVAVARTGSLAGAAEALGFVPSRMSARFQAWEARLGQPLLERHRRGVRLTEAGAALLPYAERMLALGEEAELRLAQGQASSQQLALGSMESTAAVRLPSLLARLVQEQPGLRLRLQTGPTEQLVQAVAAGELDGALVAGPIRHPLLEAWPAFEEELVLVGPPGSPSMEALVGGPPLAAVSFKVGCSYRKRFDAWLVRMGLGHWPRMELASLEGMLGLVGAGLGVAMLPRSVLQAGRLGGGLPHWPLGQGEGFVATCLVLRPGGGAQGPLGVLRALLNEQA